MTKLVAAVDGSSLGNPGAAGWAWYIDDSAWRSGGWPRATNNQAELYAVLDLLVQTQPLDAELEILCDSQYVIDSLSKWLPSWKRRGWRKKDGELVQNLELMQQLDQAMQHRRITFTKVKSHDGHRLNELVDAKARRTASAYQQGTGATAGPGISALQQEQPQQQQPQQQQPQQPMPQQAASSSAQPGFATSSSAPQHGKQQHRQQPEPATAQQETAPQHETAPHELAQLLHRTAQQLVANSQQLNQTAQQLNQTAQQLNQAAQQLLAATASTAAPDWQHQTSQQTLAKAAADAPASTVNTESHTLF